MKKRFDFADVLYEFEENGFCGDFDRCDLVIDQEFLSVSVPSYYAELFFTVRPFCNRAIAEVNCESYEAIPKIRERIAKEIVALFRTAGVIPYLDNYDSILA